LIITIVIITIDYHKFDYRNLLPANAPRGVGEMRVIHAKPLDNHVIIEHISY